MTFPPTSLPLEMAHPKEEMTAQPNYAFEYDHTIVFLRPSNNPAKAVLDAAHNRPYLVEVDPPKRPSDQQPEDISDGKVASPGEPESSCKAVCPSVLRLGFNSIEPPSLAGFTFGGSSGCTIVLPLATKGIDFTVHYILKSGALMITAGTKIMVGDSLLQKRRSLLLMQNVDLQCGKMKFSVEFPEMNHCVQAHKENYQRYSKRLEVNDARYMQTSTLYPLSIRQYISMETLGNGSFGTVHLGMDKRTGDVFAMKIITDGKPGDMTEIETMRNLHHRDHIIQYYDYIPMWGGEYCILMELAVNDLKAHIKAKREKGLSLNGIRSIATQALSALEYLHGKNITHRDMKPSNNLVTKWDQATENLTIKLCDFGLASHESRLHTKCGTDDYMAPEIRSAPLEKDGRLTFPYTKAVDIWAMEKVLGELVRDSSTRSKYAFKYPIKLINSMMSSDPTKRPTAAECLQSLWLRQREDCGDQGPLKRKASFDLTNDQAKKPGPRS